MIANAEMPAAGRSRMATLRAAAILFAFVSVLHYDVIFLGRSLVHTNYLNPLDQRPLPQNYGDHLVPQEEWVKRNLWLIANIRDPGTSLWQWEPGTQFLKEAIAKREWPFWDPYAGAGTPAMANLLPAFFFPPYTLVVLLGGSVGLRNAYFLFMLWGAAFLTFIFLRRHGLGFTASLTGGAIVAVGGGMNQYLGSIAGQAAACLPAALVATRWFLDRPTARRVAVLALTYSAISLASLPPLLFGIFAIVSLYAAVALILRDCGAAPARAALAWGSACALGVVLVAWYFLPAIALSRAVPHAAEIYRGAGLETMPFVNALQLLSPTLMGGVQVYLAAPFASDGYGAHIPYVGIVCAIAAMLAQPESGRHRTLFWFCVAGTALIALKIFGVPPIHWIGRLPVLDHIHFAHYFGVLLTFLVAFLAAMGVERLLRGETSGRRVSIVSTIAVGAVASLVAIAARDGAFGKPGAEYWTRDWAVLAALTLTALALVTMYVRGRARPATRVRVVLLLLALLTIENAYNDFHPKPAAWDMFEHPLPFLRLIRIEAPMGRILGLGVPPPNVNSAFRVFGLNSLMTFTPPRIYELYRHYGASPTDVFMSRPKAIPPERVLDHAHVRFLSGFAAVPDDIKRIESRGYGKRLDDGFVALYERPTEPRFYFSSDYRVVPSSSALEAIASTAPREVVVEENLPAPRAPNAAGDPEVSVERYRFNSLTLTVDAPRPGLVYASESFFDGWTATVNGAPARILPANYAFRAVVVPAGKATIEFRYWPPGLSAGLRVSAGGVSVLAALLLVPWQRSRTRPSTAGPPRALPFQAGT